MSESSLFSSLALVAYCHSYCTGSPPGKKDEECQYWRNCRTIILPGFEIPKDPEKFETYIEELGKGTPLYEIAEEIWESEDPDQILRISKDSDTVALPHPILLPLADERREKTLRKEINKIREELRNGFF